jgi:hypothetical protein
LREEEFAINIIYNAEEFRAEEQQRERRLMVRRSILEQIFREIQAIRFRLDELEKTGVEKNHAIIGMAESNLICLPDHLLTTYIAVASKGECSAGLVSKLTGRCRAVESNYLNQLCRMGWMDKTKSSRTTLFKTIKT